MSTQKKSIHSKGNVNQTHRAPENDTPVQIFKQLGNEEIIFLKSKVAP